MSIELDVLKHVCIGLEEAKIPYMLTGSFAANFYAVPRMTRDIDIIVEIFQRDVEKFTRIFKNNFYLDKSSVKDAIEHQGMFNIIHNDSVCKVDFIVRKDTLYRETEFQRRKQIQIDDIPIWIVSPEDLVISKLYWAKDSSSEMQIKDIKNLLQSHKNLDREYILHWVQKLGVQHIYKKVESDG